MRHSNRAANELRKIEIIRHYTRHAEGSVLVKFGDTHVLCTASIDEKVPGFLKGKNQGWLTAEYGMLPRATNTRTDREAARGKQSGRTQERGASQRERLHAGPANPGEQLQQRRQLPEQHCAAER